MNGIRTFLLFFVMALCVASGYAAAQPPAKPATTCADLQRSVDRLNAGNLQLEKEIDALLVKLAEMDGKLGPQAFDDTRSIIERLDRIEDKLGIPSDQR